MRGGGAVGVVLEAAGRKAHGKAACGTGQPAAYLSHYQQPPMPSTHLNPGFSSSSLYW